MKKILFWTTALLMTLTALGLNVPASADESEKYPVPSATVVQVMLGEGWCTGVHVGEGFFLTARHCFSDMTIPSNFNVTVNENETYIKWAWKRHDVALLKVPGMETYPAASVSCDMPAVGDPVKAEGRAQYIGWTLSFGSVSGLKTDDEDEPDMFMHTAPVTNGMSGGPVWNVKGELIGINTAILTANAAFSYASPVAKFCREIPGTPAFIEQQKKDKKSK